MNSPRSRELGTRAAGELATQATRALAAAALITVFLAAMYALETIDYLQDGRLDQYGIRAHDVNDLPDILSAPFLHGSFEHLMANTIPFAVLGGIAAFRGPGKFLAMNLIVIVIGGLGVWFTGPGNAETLGASILVFGYFGYLVGRGLFERHIADVLIAVAVGLLYGGILISVVPTDEMISWQGHLFGLIGGIVAAFTLRRRRRAM